MDDDRTRGWLMARVELAIAVIAVLVSRSGGSGSRSPLPRPSQTPTTSRCSTVYPIAAEIVMLLGLAWMIRIWRGPTREAPPAWRYRDGD